MIEDWSNNLRPKIGGQIEMNGFEDTMSSPKPDFKYDEKKILSELGEYVASTYGQHYVGDDNIQAVDLIMASGHGIGFFIGDIIKYASRYGKKKGQERKDILKILHYGMFLLHLHDKMQKNKKFGGPDEQVR